MFFWHLFCSRCKKSAALVCNMKRRNVRSEVSNDFWHVCPKFPVQFIALDYFRLNRGALFTLPLDLVLLVGWFVVWDVDSWGIYHLGESVWCRRPVFLTCLRLKRQITLVTTYQGKHGRWRLTNLTRCHRSSLQALRSSSMSTMKSWRLIHYQKLCEVNNFSQQHRDFVHQPDNFYCVRARSVKRSHQA